MSEESCFQKAKRMAAATSDGEHGESDGVEYSVEDQRFHPSHFAPGDPARDAWLAQLVVEGICPRCATDTVSPRTRLSHPQNSISRTDRNLLQVLVKKGCSGGSDLSDASECLGVDTSKAGAIRSRQGTIGGDEFDPRNIGIVDSSVESGVRRTPLLPDDMLTRLPQIGGAKNCPCPGLRDDLIDIETTHYVKGSVQIGDDVDRVVGRNPPNSELVSSSVLHRT
jgi:hypothetical protein